MILHNIHPTGLFFKEKNKTHFRPNQEKGLYV